MFSVIVLKVRRGPQIIFGWDTFERAKAEAERALRDGAWKAIVCCELWSREVNLGEKV